MTAPTISVSLVTYNHEKYVAAAIESILSQTFRDFELIIVDDGSTDDTPREIARFTDPRIVSVRRVNGGPSVATNTAIDRARGTFIATMTGDDVSVPHRLEAQLAKYRERGEPHVLFAACDFIDDAGRPLKGKHFAADFFDTSNKTRAQTFRRLYNGNFINSVTTFTERSVFQALGPYDPVLLQLQDYDMWVRAIKRFPIALSSEVVLHYRIRAGQGNLSAPSQATWTRYVNESYLVMRHFFDGAGEEFFREAFQSDLRKSNLRGTIACECEQALLFLHHDRPDIQYIGMERLHRLFGNPESAEILAREFAFPLQDFFAWCAKFDPLRRFADQQSTLYVDTGRGFDDKAMLRVFCRHEPQFRIAFPLSGFANVRAIRWDPVELRLANVQLERVTLMDANGTRRDVPLAHLTANGTPRGHGHFEFQTLDPSITVPVKSTISEAILEGKWQIASADETLARLHATRR